MERAQKAERPVVIDAQEVVTDYDSNDDTPDGLQRTPVNDLFITDENGERLELCNVKNWFYSMAVADNTAEKLRQIRRVFDTAQLSSDQELIDCGLGRVNVDPTFFRYYLEMAFEMCHREVMGAWHNEDDEANRVRINRLNTLRQSTNAPARLRLSLSTVQRYEETRDRLT